MFIKDTLYKRLISSVRWTKLRNAYIKTHPICESCHNHLATQVHHIQPLMKYRDDPKMMEKMCYDEDNIMSVCDDCHNKIHKELGKFSHRKEDIKNINKEKLTNFYNEYFK